MLGVTSFGIQDYLPVGDSRAPQLFAGIIETLYQIIITNHIATAEEIGLETLEQRLADELGHANAVLAHPTLVGAWGRVPLAG